jgi:hypothetical protein
LARSSINAYSFDAQANVPPLHLWRTQSVNKEPVAEYESRALTGQVVGQLLNIRFGDWSLGSPAK